MARTQCPSCWSIVDARVDYFNTLFGGYEAVCPQCGGDLVFSNDIGGQLAEEYVRNTLPAVFMPSPAVSSRAEPSLLSILVGGAALAGGAVVLGGLGLALLAAMDKEKPR